MLSLEVYKRDTKAKKLRKEGKVPGVIYGPNFDSTPVYAEAKIFNKFFKNYESGLFKFIFENKEYQGILQEVQFHPLTDEIIHFDIFVPSLEEEIETEIPLEFVGEAPAIKKGGVLSINLEEIEVSALATNLPENIKVDLSILKEIGQSIYVKDLKVPTGVKILTPADVPVVTIISERKEEEEKEEVPETPSEEKIPETPSEATTQ